MAQIRSKQIADFLSTVNWSTVTTSQIPNASNVKTYISDQINATNSITILSIDSLEVALSGEIAATNTDVSRINQSIDSLEVVLSGEISDTNSDVVRINQSVDSLEVALSGEIAATNSDVVKINQSVDSLEVALSGEIAATNTDVSRINQSVDSLEVALSGEIAATNSDVVRIDLKDGQQDGRLDALEGLIMEDTQELTEVFAGSGVTYTLSNPVQDSNKNLVHAYVNGLLVPIETVVNAVVTLSPLEYTIIAADNVTFTYQF